MSASGSLRREMSERGEKKPERGEKKPSSLAEDEQARKLQQARLRKAYRADIFQQMSEKRQAEEEVKAEGRALRLQIEEQDAEHNENERLKQLERKKLMVKARTNCEEQMDERRLRNLAKRRAEQQEGAEIREEDARAKKAEEEKRQRIRDAMRADFQNATRLLEAREKKRKGEKDLEVKAQLKAIDDMEEQWRVLDEKRAKYFSDIQAKQNSIQGAFASTTGAERSRKMADEKAKQDRDELQEHHRWKFLLERREMAREEQRKDMLATLDQQVEEDKDRRAKERQFRNTFPIDMAMEIREREEARKRHEKQQNLKMELLSMIEEKRRRQQQGGMNSAGSLRSGGGRPKSSIFAESDDQFYAETVGTSYERIRPYEGWELTNMAAAATKLPPAPSSSAGRSASKTTTLQFPGGLSTMVDASRHLDKPLGRIVQRDLGKTRLCGDWAGTASMPSLTKQQSSPWRKKR